METDSLGLQKPGDAAAAAEGEVAERLGVLESRGEERLVSSKPGEGVMSSMLPCF